MGAIANENLKWSKQMTQLVHPDVVNLMREAIRYAQFKEKTLTPELMFAAMLKNPDPVVREFLRRWSVNVAIFEPLTLQEKHGLALAKVAKFTRLTALPD